MSKTPNKNTSNKTPIVDAKPAEDAAKPGAIATEIANETSKAAAEPIAARSKAAPVVVVDNAHVVLSATTPHVELTVDYDNPHVHDKHEGILLTGDIVEAGGQKLKIIGGVECTIRSGRHFYLFDTAPTSGIMYSGTARIVRAKRKG